MREIVAGKGIKPGTRLDEYVMSTFPALPKNALYKAFRKKDVKIDGKWAAPDAALKPSDKISVYLPDDILFGRQSITSASGVPPVSPGTPRDMQGLSSSAKRVIGEGSFSIVYEDERLLIVNKARGLPVHPDRSGRGITLIELVHEYLDAADRPYAPAMCHRIDRNTGGLVMIAKDRAALEIILSKLNVNSIKKDYRCIVAGKPKPAEAKLYAFITKDAARGKAEVYSGRESAPENASKIVTYYRTLSYDRRSDTSKLEVSLQTGRTHQIRAHLSSIGHPIIGDGKYCPNAINRQFGEHYQMLVAFRLVFPDMPGMKASRITVEISDGLAHPQLKNL